MKYTIEFAIQKNMKSLLAGRLRFTNNKKCLRSAKANSFTSLFEPDMHRYLELVTILEGKAALQINSRIIEMGTNETWAILPHTSHCEGFVGKEKTYTLLWAVIISRGISFFISEHHSAKNRQTTSRLFVESSQAKPLWEIGCNPTLSTDILLQAKFYSLFLTVCLKGLNDINNHSSTWSSNQQKFVQQVKDYIEQHYREKLSIAEIAQFAGYTPNYLGTLFQKYTNQTIHQYLIEVRLKSAQKLFASGQHQIKEIAYLVGLDDSLYFSRLFRKHFGKSPSEYASAQKCT